ncbi:MAG: hypothetical protein HOA14_12735, partial [Planctomycetaceae bacterium]|nr:hypothetical protein [Planctomycetaceae bacterium]
MMRETNKQHQAEVEKAHTKIEKDLKHAAKDSNHIVVKGDVLKNLEAIKAADVEA